ncbi:MAG: 3,4-dihydroxy-2-butanone-4-phosphate synthase [Betaproteobacteria bacterium]|nr:3,4-dihydroxy-2-butanone-4-phosphate synthase [Betaproteobacteria bacterium]
MTLASVPEILDEIREGRMVVLVDEEERENEGDLVLAADFVTPEAINFMARYGRGLICLTLTEERCRQLNLPLMAVSNRSPLGTNFTVSIEAAEGVTTGISAADRAHTIRVAVARHAQPADIVQPGHVFPLMAHKGGVLARAGHTEAGCDLARLAGLTPAAVICEILKEDGSMARLADLVEFARPHRLKIGSIADLIHYRGRTESLVERVLERELETPHGCFHLVAYRDKTGEATHVALVRGSITPETEVVVRVHEPLSVVDLLDLESRRHSWTLHRALARVAGAPCGVLVLLHRTESGADVLARLQPNAVGRHEGKTLRNYGIGAQILRDLGIRRMRLLAVPRKMPSWGGFDLDVTGYLQPEAREIPKEI